MQTPTTYAAAARHQSKNGEDLVHYLDKTGAIVYWASSDGTHYCKDCVTHDGISVSDLQNQINNIQFSGLPSVIDCGTF